MTDEEFNKLVAQANEALTHMGECTCASKLLKFEGARAFQEPCTCHQKKKEKNNE
jgi:hypothetical protein